MVFAATGVFLTLLIYVTHTCFNNNTGFRSQFQFYSVFGKFMRLKWILYPLAYLIAAIIIFEILLHNNVIPIT